MRAQRKRYKRFLKDVEKRREDYLNQVCLAVLLWGPYESCPLKDKMEEIYEELMFQGHAPIYSYQACDQDIHLGLDEMAQVESADVVVILAGSFGSVGEVNHFATVPELAKKMMVFWPEDAIDGFNHQANEPLLTATGLSASFSQEDLDQCSLKKKVMEMIHKKRVSEAYRLRMLDLLNN